MAVLAVAAAAAKSAAVADVADKVGDALKGIFGGATKLDKQRKDLTAQLFSAAMAGDGGALRQLTFNAYEKRRGLPGDSRTPVDGKASPPDTRTLAIRSLKAYVQAKGGLPEELSAYAARLNAPVIPRNPSIGQQVGDILRRGVQQGVEQGTRDAAAAQVGGVLDRYGWLFAAGGLALVGFIVYKAAK